MRLIFNKLILLFLILLTGSVAQGSVVKNSEIIYHRAFILHMDSVKKSTETKDKPTDKKDKAPEKGKTNPEKEVKKIPEAKPHKRPTPVTSPKSIKRPKNIRPKGVSTRPIIKPAGKGPGKKN